MMRVLSGWTLGRSPLAPSVPIDGSETVEGLRTLERLRAASLLQTNGTGGNNARQEEQRQNRRRRYQRFKGPFLEQMTTEDFKKDPRPWKQFAGTNETSNTPTTDSYNVPATLDVMCERIEENACYYLTNYLRVAVIVIMLTMYLRPKAVLGVAAIAISMYINLPRALAAATEPAQQQRHRQQDPTDQMWRGALAVGTWITVAYTKCMPILCLGILLALGVVTVHAAARQAPSEARHRGRTPLGYSLWQVLGRQPVPEGQDPRLLGKQLWHEVSRAVVWRARHTGRWGKYYALTALDAIKRPFMRNNQSIGGGWR